MLVGYEKTTRQGEDMSTTSANGLAIELHGLTKEFGNITAVNDLSVRVERGGVIGLLGPNGAGKSTTIRMLLGLIAPTHGSGHVLGHDVRSPSAYMQRVGALVEAPVFYPKLSGRDNLRTLAVLAGVDNERIDEVLEIVDLTGRDTDRAGDYSLGMKQRLAIADIDNEALMTRVVIVVRQEAADEARDFDPPPVIALVESYASSPLPAPS